VGRLLPLQLSHRLQVLPHIHPSALCLAHDLELAWLSYICPRCMCSLPACLEVQVELTDVTAVLLVC
jgi:hypothetical protein